MNNREAFEARMRKTSTSDLTINRFGNYRSTYVQNKWNDFQAGYQAALASQQDHIGDSNKLVNKVVFDSESARQFLIESVLPKFSDSTFQKYVLEELAGDFAYQLAMYLASQAQQTESRHLSIESAPKDGMLFLSWGKHSTIPTLTKYSSEYGWFESEDGVHLYNLVCWMPLPPAPEGE